AGRRPCVTKGSGAPFSCRQELRRGGGKAGDSRPRAKRAECPAQGLQYRGDPGPGTGRFGIGSQGRNGATRDETGGWPRGADPPTDLYERAGLRATGAPPSCYGRLGAPLQGELSAKLTEGVAAPLASRWT